MEAGNNADKHAVVHKKTSLFEFVKSAARTIIAPASMQDTLYEGRLKSRSNTRGANTAVYNIKYFEHISAIEEVDKQGLPTFMHMAWKYCDEWNDIPKGSFLIAGAHCLSEMRKVTPPVAEEVFNCKKKAKHWLGVGGSDTWINIFKQLVKETEEMCSSPFMLFDVLVGWSQTFHIIRPIEPDNGGPKEKAIRYYVEWMADINQFPMILAEEVIARGKQGLVSCTCHAYLHYCFCKHMFLILKKREIFLGYPPTMCPVQVNRRKRCGRPKDIRGGEALL